MVPSFWVLVMLCIKRKLHPVRLKWFVNFMLSVPPPLLLLTQTNSVWASSVGAVCFDRLKSRKYYYLSFCYFLLSIFYGFFFVCLSCSGFKRIKVKTQNKTFMPELQWPKYSKVALTISELYYPWNQVHTSNIQKSLEGPSMFLFFPVDLFCHLFFGFFSFQCTMKFKIKDVLGGERSARSVKIYLRC